MFLSMKLEHGPNGMADGEGEQVGHDAELERSVEFVVAVDGVVAGRHRHDRRARLDHFVVGQRQVAHHVGVPPLRVARRHSNSKVS